MVMPSGLALVMALAIVVLVAVILWPQQGLYARLRRYLRRDSLVLQEDALKHIFAAGQAGVSCTMASVSGALDVRSDEALALLTRLQTRGLIYLAEQSIQLTPVGKEMALSILRAHRLWERYLAEETGFDARVWHALADRREHTLTPEEVELLARRLGQPTHDPHGDPIPTIDGSFVPHEGIALSALSPPATVTILHLEDEPEPVYAELVAIGLGPGMQLQLSHSSDDRISFWANGREHSLTPIVARNISVQRETQAEAVAGPLARVRSLADLGQGESATIRRLSPLCRGAERRRFFDLGILTGTRVAAELGSPGGGLTAYRIRGALIALRREQASLIELADD